MLASHLPLETAGFLEAVDPPWDRPRVCWARVATRAGPLTVAAVHLIAPQLPGARSRRDAQRTELVRQAQELATAGERLIVGGDFNTRDPHLGGMTDACAVRPAPTWRPLAVPWMPPMLGLDAIFVSPTLPVLTGGVEERSRGSDHLPVVARIGF